MKLFNRKIIAAGALAFLWAGAANAGTVSIVGNTDPANHTATLTWNASGAPDSGGSVPTLTITLANTSNDGIITAFGFSFVNGDTGTISSMVVSGTLKDSGWAWQACSQPSIGAQECAVTGPNEFGGKVLYGIPTTNPDSVGTFVFTGSFQDPTNLTDFFVRWQRTTGGGSDKGFECTDPNGCLPGFPEPGTLALFGMGLLGLAASRRRRLLIA